MARPGPGRSRDEEPHSLDHVLSSTEFETSQHEQAIQNELDKIQAYEREIEEKERETEDCERVVTEVESRREKTQRQLQLNRDNIESEFLTIYCSLPSLKHTATVLDEHLEALNKTYQSAIQETQHKCAEYDAAVSKYAEKWESYQSTYKKMPAAQKLSAIEETLNQVKSDEAALDAEIAEIQKALKDLTSEGQEATVKWVLQIASVRVETDGILRLLRSTRQAVYVAQKELDTSSAQLLKAKQAAEKDELNKVPSELRATPMDTSTEVTHSPTNDGESTNLPPSSHDCMAPDGDLPPQNQQPHSTSLQSTTHTLVPLQTNASTTFTGQEKAPATFAIPQGPPRRFAIPKPSQKSAGITVSSAKVSSTATVINSQTQHAVGGTPHGVPIIPPAFQLQSPKPPSSSPKLTNPPSSGGEKEKRSFKLPKFSIPRHSENSITSSSPLSQYRPQRVGGQVHKSSEQNVSNIKPAQSVSSQYQLKLPSKPVPPCSPRISTPKPSTSQQPPKLFTLPQMSELSTRTPQQSSETQHRLPGTGVAPQKSLNSASPTEGLSVSTVPASTSNPGMVDVSPLGLHTTPQENQEQYEPSSRQYVGTYQHGLQEQQLRSREAPHDQMEVSSAPGHLTEGGEGGVEMMDDVFNPASTSIDFGEQSIDFDSSGPLFGLQSDDMFNISQTEPFFNMNQGTPESTGGFSFMQMTLNEDESSSTSIQDFFSQFGKTTDTSSHSETAGKFLF